MIDKTREKADKELRKLERKIKKAYKEAQKAITEEWNAYMKRAAERIQKAQAEYDAVLRNGTREQIAEASQKLQAMKQSQLLRNNHYKAMVDVTTTELANVNKTALAYANGMIPSMYAIGYGNPSEVYAVPENIADAIKMSFEIRDEHTIKRRIIDGDIELPNQEKRFKIPKDKRWNTKQINSSVLQGILKGESINKIAKRLYPIMDNNMNAAIRNARTLMTGAENRGRLDRYKDLEKQGAVLKKVWMSTGDGRTRDWHLEMDGQEVDVDDEFIDGLGNELMYPGDAGAPPETVYNCRCTMHSKVVGFRKPNGNIRYIDYDRSNDNLEHKNEIQRERNKRRK